MLCDFSLVVMDLVVLNIMSKKTFCQEIKKGQPPVIN
jgi:hypothetical protein